jgi:hypothetical protein
MQHEVDYDSDDEFWKEFCGDSSEPSGADDDPWADEMHASTPATLTVPALATSLATPLTMLDDSTDDDSVYTSSDIDPTHTPTHAPMHALVGASIGALVGTPTSASTLTRALARASPITLSARALASVSLGASSRVHTSKSENTSPACSPPPSTAGSTRRKTNFHLINIYRVQIVSLMNGIARAESDEEMAEMFNQVQDLQLRILEERGDDNPELKKRDELISRIERLRRELAASEEELARTNESIARKEIERASRFH